MRRTIVAGGTLAVILGLIGIADVALAGGGCHGGATQQDATGKEEATVRMVDACFTASITTVDPGTDVTFVNEDGKGVTHNVGGTLWGNYETMLQGDTYTATFDEPGIYPFACSYHPGMTGAIVVGDGKGAGNGFTVSTTPPKLDEPVATTPATATGGVGTPWLVAAVIGGLAIGALASAVAGRGRKAVPAG
jgi:plastocyanin